MPYTTDSPPRPAKNWSKPARALCARVANGVLKGGGSDQQAVYACIAAVKRRYPGTIKAPKSDWRKAAEDFFEGKTEEELRKIFAPLLPDLIEFVPWKSATKTGLPDSAYAIVYQPKNGPKIRALPHHTSSGSLDLPHLRNALARWNQVAGVPIALKVRGHAHLEAHARSAGVGEHDKAASDFTAEFYDIAGIEFREIADGKYASTLQVLPEGKFIHPWYGDLDFSASVLRSFKRNFDNRILGTDIMVDEGHNRGKALGWYKELHFGKRSLGDKEYVGLWGDIEWTDLGKDYLERKIYKYFSAEVGNWTSPQGDKVENVLLGGGLTNRPFFKSMPEVQLNEGEASDRFVIGLFGDEQWSFGSSTNEEDSSFSAGYHEPYFDEEEEDDVEMDELLAAINAAYQKDFADQDQLLAFIAELNKSNTEAARFRTTFAALGIEFSEGEDPVSAVAKAFKTARDESVSLNTRLVAVESRLADTEFDGLFSENLRAGKVVPKQREKMRKLFNTDKALFVDLMADAEPVVLLGERGFVDDEEPGSSSDSRYRDGTDETAKEAARYGTLAGGQATPVGRRRNGRSSREGQ
jgi:hypothetical protein